MTDHHRSLDRALACTCPPSAVSPSCPTHGRRWGGEAAQGTDVEALAEVIGCVSEFRPRVCTVIARAILASAWLERHDAETIEAAESAAGERIARAWDEALGTLIDTNRVLIRYDDDEAAEFVAVHDLEELCDRMLAIARTSSASPPDPTTSGARDEGGGA